LERIAPIDRRLVWDACLNARDLGGLPCGDSALVRGRLARSSMIGTLSPAGRASVRAHGIRTVIDLRTLEELAQTPSPFRDGLTYRHAPFSAAQTMGIHRAALGGTMSDALRQLAAPGGGLAPAIAAIAESEPGILIHCLAGRDRTGIVVAVTLAAIGVPDEEIVADYVASDAELADDYVRFKSLNPDKASEVDAAVERRAWTMGEVLTTLRLAFGGARGYLATAGVTPAEIGAIRTKLLS
jgi:protein-tyrosine phosphatase